MIHEEQLQMIKKYDRYFLEAHTNAKQKLFWEDKETNRDKKDELIALMVDEASELHEAMRKQKQVCITNFNQEENFEAWFLLNIKGSLGEEIADIMIRMFDFACAYELKTTTIVKYITKASHNIENIDIRPRSFILFLMRDLTDIKFSSFPSEAIGEAAAKCFKIAEFYNIDIWKYIDYKMQYNKMREPMHGKIF